MKQLLISVILSGAILLPALSFGQSKYTYKKKDPNTVGQKKTYQYTPANSKKYVPPTTLSNQKKNNTGLAVPIKGRTKAHTKGRPSSNVTDPRIINDPINIYKENPELIKATLSVQLINVNCYNPNNLNFQLNGNPYYDYHQANHIMIINTNISNNFYSDTLYTIPLYVKSKNHWKVTFNDFETKWIIANPNPLDFNTRSNMVGGSILLHVNNINGTITRVKLILQFASGTKTIVWDHPIHFNALIAPFQFDQNFNPIY